MLIVALGFAALAVVRLAMSRRFQVTPLALAVGAGVLVLFWRLGIAALLFAGVAVILLSFARRPASKGPTSTMSRADALALLGLAEGADVAAIKAAHRRKIAAAHPDIGGSQQLAARLNAARDVLLKS